MRRGGDNGCDSGLLGVTSNNIQQDRTAFAFWAAPSGECNYYIQEVCNLSRPFPQFSENHHHDIIMTPPHSLPMQDVGVIGYF